jgi:hypothetical protein
LQNATSFDNRLQSASERGGDHGNTDNPRRPGLHASDFPLGYAWHLVAFHDYYEGLAVYRQDVIIPFGVISMLVQGIAWAVIYWRMFAGEPVVRGAVKFAALAMPLAWSFMVLAVAAKHRMASGLWIPVDRDRIHCRSVPGGQPADRAAVHIGAKQPIDVRASA